MFSTRATAIAVGVFFLISHVTSVTSAFFLLPNESTVRLGALVEVFVALSVVGTAVALYPVIRLISSGFSIGYVALRTLEAGVILVGVTAVLSTAPDLYDFAFIVGPGLICPVNTIVLAVVLYRSRLVPRFIPILGFIGAPLVFAANAAKLLGVFEGLPAWVAIGVVPLFAWEICLAVYLIARGFKTPVASRFVDTRAELVRS